jgi:Protein affecting phage T7 exclusion by the F plasmid
MLMIPFPFILAEIVIFFTAVNHWGFWETMGNYFLPSILGVLIVSTVGRMAMMNLQGSVAKGQMPANKLLQSGAIFISGLLLIVPSFFTRVFGVLLLLPGTRHFLVWRFKKYAAQKMSQGSARAFNFGGFGNFGNAGFKYYEYRSAGGGFDQPQERDVHPTDINVLDVKPIEITHEIKKDDSQ